MWLWIKQKSMRGHQVWGLDKSYNFILPWACMRNWEMCKNCYRPSNTLATTASKAALPCNGFKSLLTPCCRGRLVFFHLSLKFLPPFNIWKIWNDLRLFSKYLRVPILRPLRSKGDRGWIFEAATSKFCNHFWKFGCQPQKSKADLCLTNNVKVLIYLTLTSLFLQYYKRFQNQAYLWTWHSSRCPPKIFCQSEQLSLSKKLCKKKLSIPKVWAKASEVGPVKYWKSNTPDQTSDEIPTHNVHTRFISVRNCCTS